jgi:hypothetical protein
MDELYILISNNEDNIYNIDSNYIYKHVILLDFNKIIDDVKTSFRNDNNIIEQFILDCKRSNILINNEKYNYKILNKYIRERIDIKYYTNYLICFTQALLSIPYSILVNSTSKYVGELNTNEKDGIGDYFNIVVNDNQVKIYKLLRVFSILNDDNDKTAYYIKISIKFELNNNPEYIYLYFKIIKKKINLNKIRLV